MLCTVLVGMVRLNSFCTCWNSVDVADRQMSLYSKSARASWSQCFGTLVAEEPEASGVPLFSFFSTSLPERKRGRLRTSLLVLYF
uniref:Secreted protein n=1 Tax=Anguilla anguilla TaxID=7936 RepID=A0A0E9PRB3_ANGAN